MVEYCSIAISQSACYCEQSGAIPDAQSARWRRSARNDTLWIIDNKVALILLFRLAKNQGDSLQTFQCAQVPDELLMVLRVPQTDVEGEF